MRGRPGGHVNVDLYRAPEMVVTHERDIGLAHDRPIVAKVFLVLDLDERLALLHQLGEIRLGVCRAQIAGTGGEDDDAIGPE